MVSIILKLTILFLQQGQDKVTIFKVNDKDIDVDNSLALTSVLNSTLINVHQVMLPI